MAGERGLMFSPLQIGRKGSAVALWYEDETERHLTLPDVTIWTCPGQHHEIKHKNPTAGGYFGLEQYRLEALLRFADSTGQSVLYTIHNHGLSGGTDSPVNNIAHWFTIDVKKLNGTWKYIDRNGTSWINSVKTHPVTICYWHNRLWRPLSELWSGMKVRTRITTAVSASSGGHRDAWEEDIDRLWEQMQPTKATNLDWRYRNAR